MQVKPARQPDIHLPRSSSWIPPPENFIKINVDAGVNSEGNFGMVGAVCRSQDGKFMGASSMTVPHITDPPTLEAMAVREALALASDLHVEAIHIASDCKTVVEDIKKRTNPQYGAILQEIDSRRQNFISCNISFESRSSNFEAHNLAKHTMTLGYGRHVWLGHPGKLSFMPVNLVMF